MTTATLTLPRTGTITTPGMSADEFELMLTAATRLTQRTGPDNPAGHSTALAEELGSGKAYEPDNWGPHYLSVKSECSWTLKVTDGDGAQ